MNKIQKWNGSIQHPDRDIRLEVILAEWIEDGLSLDEIVITPNSLFSRGYHRDIERTDDISDSSSHKTKIRVTVNRDGLYDLLPQDLFHQPPAPTLQADAENISAEMKRQAEIEKASRLFFLPYEQEFYRQRIMLEKKEKDFLFETNSNLSIHLLEQLWNFPEYLDHRQKSKLGMLMPVINQLAGDWAQVAAVMEIITGDKVRISRDTPVEEVLPDGGKWENVRLGVTTILGGIIREMQPSMRLTICLPGPQQLTDYMPGGQKIKVFEFLASLLVPLETDLVYELDFAAEIPFGLEEDLAWSGRLNYTTTI